MRDIFEAELTQLGDNLVQLSERVNTAISAAGTALLTADVALAQQTISEDDAIDALARDTDDRAVLLLAQQAPVATDLRVVVSTLRMSATLERMGDLAQHIAQVARRSYPQCAIPEPVLPVFKALHQSSVSLAERLTRLLETRDLLEANAIERDDDIIDDLHHDTFSALLNPNWAGTTQETIDITLVGRYYERFGDHGVSIARRVIYLVTGTDIAHV
ncbi:phosphate signaling complex protein PhoU [Rarobacter incanus]|uniref:Phosphate-specific transport system accessory protein PhoU n=1 Tax=Rarobacter incanus TaxID=153494 RepID=A0A542SP60_9MICO|nr:phosphate signaling complex protein PhoU [Rarobacter incanus]TQK76348.1 PhoU-like phosphate uptake regulator [Rarobacter incanus]